MIMDAYTKQVLSYTLSPSLEVDFVLDAVDILMREHGVSLHAETVIHSDQGCHYTSCKFIELVEHNELRRSMSRKGNCWDNAPQESFFGHNSAFCWTTSVPLTSNTSFFLSLVRAAISRKLLPCVPVCFVSRAFAGALYVCAP